MSTKAEIIKAAIDKDVEEYEEHYKKRVDRALTNLNEINIKKYGVFRDIDYVSIFSFNKHAKCRAIANMHNTYVNGFKLSSELLYSPFSAFIKCELYVVLREDH